MSALATLQRRFRDHLLDHPGTPLEPLIRAPAVGDRGRRLGIYHDGYRLRLREALATEYRGLAALLGDDGFAQLADAYAAAHPSARPSIRWYGDRLAGFMAETAPWNGRPELAELARFEWTEGLCLDAADAPRLTADAVADLPADAWPGLRIVFHPSVHRLDLAWNSHALYRAATEESPLPTPTRHAAPQPWLFWRWEQSAYFASLAPDAAAMLDGLRRGDRFADVCTTLLHWHDDAATMHRAAALLRGWFDEGLISRADGPG